MKRAAISILGLCVLVTAILTAGFAEENTAEYRVYCVDRNGDPVAGVTLSLCTQTLCRAGQTDERGCYEFETIPQAYTVHIISLPCGYSVDPLFETVMEEDTLTVVLQKD